MTGTVRGVALKGGALKYLTEPEVYSLLKRYGICVPNHLTFGRDEVPIWKSFPAFVKVVSRSIVHKSRGGGVERVESEAELERAVERLKERFPHVEEFIVEEEVKGIEAFVGVKRDPSFSHVIAIGSGGVYVEVFRDVTFIPLDANGQEIEKSLNRTKLPQLLKRKGIGLESLIPFLNSLKFLIRENPEISELDLNPTFISEGKVVPADGRAFLSNVERRRAFKPLSDRLFEPKSVAVIGATPKHGKVGYAVLRNLDGFKGKVFPVNPKYKSILGRKCFGSVLDVEDEVECAVICIPSKVVPPVVEECGRKGVKLVVIISAGFSEVGEEGKELQDRVLRIAQSYGMRILGPNTLGFMIPPLKLNASFSSTMPEEGNISFLSQSGALITAVVDMSLERNIGFSQIVSLGNQSDIEISEAFDLATRDERTKVILSYVEGLELGDKLISFLKRKPSVFLKVGRGKGGKRAASSHTGSLAGNFKVFKDVVEAKGGIVVDAVDEAFDCCQFLSSYGRLEGKRVMIVTNAGGPGALASDYVSYFNLKLADIKDIYGELNRFLPKNWSRINPIDLIGDATSERYRAAFSKWAFSRRSLPHRPASADFGVSAARGLFVLHK